MKDTGRPGGGAYPGGAAERLLVLVFLVGVFLLAFNKISDPDAWIHLDIGRLVFDLGGLPAEEMFVYPLAGVPFKDSYPFWLFGAVCYAVYSAAGAGGLVVFKALTIAATFFFMLRDSLRPSRNMAIALLVMVAAVELSHYRFVLRPEIFQMLFLAFGIFSLNAYLYAGKKYLYALPVVHMVWANSHTSINLMFIPFLAFIAGGLLQRRLEGMGKGYAFHRTPSSSQIRAISLVFLLSFAASLINPYPVSAYLYGPRVMSQEWQKAYIIELVPLEGAGRAVILGMAAVVLSSFFLNRRSFSLIHLFLVIPFLALPFTAIRFIPLLAVVALPAMARNIALSLESRGQGPLPRRRALNVAALAALALYFTLTRAGAGPFGLHGMEFGLGFNYGFVPKGAVDYMDREGIYGRTFNTCTFGQYIIWRGYPERTVFIDGKGYFKDLMRQSLEAPSSAELLEELHGKYGFDSVLIEHRGPRGRSGDLLGPRKTSLAHPGWALVYWDDMSLLYLKRDGKYGALAERDEYRSADPGASLEEFRRCLSDSACRRGMADELRRNVRETGSERANRLLLQFEGRQGRQAAGAEG